MDTIEKQNLATRTRQRNALTWLSLDYGGVMAPLVGMEADLDALAGPGIENFMAISDEAWGIKEDQRDKTVELSQAEVDQDRLIAEAKVATGRAKIAIERVADEYALAAKVYDVKVKGLLMGAKEFAALVEVEQLANEEAKAGLAVDKEALRLAKIQTDIKLQTIERAQVEADLAKAQVDVAKAHVRALMADIEAGKAEIELIEAQTQAAIAEADKNTLIADVAMIFAEIMVKKLSSTKLAVGAAEIAAGYGYIQSKLGDAIALYNIKAAIEFAKAAGDNSVAGAVGMATSAEVASEHGRVQEAAASAAGAREAASIHVSGAESEVSARESIGEARGRIAAARGEIAVAREEGAAAAAEAIAEAQAEVHAMRTITTTSRLISTEIIGS